MPRTARAAALALAWAATVAATPPVVLRPEVVGVDSPVAVSHAGDGSRRLFVAQRDGRILVVAGGARRGALFADLSSRVSCCEQERGLLGLAFHPRYRENGWLFVNYTDSEGDSVIARLSVSDDPDRAKADSLTELLRIPQPGPYHNSAHLAFGPDGFLYVGVGDGSNDGDGDDNAQSPGSLLGKILRLDVDAAPPYAIPEDNPFAGVPEAQPEIWALGLRNPWRFSFDRKTGDLYIGDVGQNRFEEIDFQPAGSAGGANYGWRLKEGSACFEPPEGCDREGLTEPLFSYPHDPDADGCSGSVIGGVRYRGPDVPTLTGLYVFADFCSRDIWGGRRNSAGNWLFRRLVRSEARIVSFGEDERGRLLAAALAGRVYRLAGRALFASDFEDPRLADWSRRKGRPRTGPAPAGAGSALRLELDGTSHPVFVRSREPEAEPYLRVAFDLTLGRADLGDSPLEILRFAGDGLPLSLFVEHRDGRYSARLVAREDDGGRRLVGVTGLPGAATVRLDVQWMRATSAEVADGEVTLLKNGRIQARAVDLDSDTMAVDSVLLGLPSGSGGGRAGTLLIDDYSSSR